MLKLGPHELAELIINTIRDLHDEGELADITPDDDLGYSCETVFGFHAADVEGIHTHKIGSGDGLWFRLKDGRVISGLRDESDPNPALYDTVQN